MYKVKKSRNKSKLLSQGLILFLLATNIWAAGTIQSTHINGVKVDYYVPKALTPTLSADGKSVLNVLPARVYIADPTPPAVPVRIPAPLSVSSMSSSDQTVLATSEFSVTYIPDGGTDKWGEDCFEFPAEAKAAFDAAVAIWESILSSSVPITIKAGWADLGSSSILGYSGGGTLSHNFPGAPLANTSYIASLANSLAGYDIDIFNHDMHITYNKNFSWYFGTDGNPPYGQYDFMSVVLHEIGHGLNFAGTMSYSSGSGSWGSYPNVYDTFIEDVAGVSLLNTTTYPNPSTALGSALTSGSVWFDGPAAVAANGGQRVKVYAPSTWQPGSSYSHLDYSTFAGTENRLMVYAIASASSIHNPGSVTSGMLADMGWVLSDSNAPGSFSANTIDKFSIELSWMKNEAGDDVLVAWSTNAIFGTPSGVYAPGSSIVGGGTVLYNGASTDMMHTGLDIGTEYFYKAWSILSSGVYSEGITASAVTENLLSEGFEHGGTIPDGWSQSYETGTLNWTFVNGDGGYGHPANAHNGSYNAYLFDATEADDKTKLITPEMNFGTAAQNVELTFWHCMDKWHNDQDELRVYYKTSAGGSWNLLETYTSDTGVWTERIITLPNPNSTYYVAFEGNAKYGYGVCIDDVHITGDNILPSSHIITVSSIGDGVVSPSGTVSVVDGGMTNFVITADARRHIVSIQTNGTHIAGSPFLDNSFISTNYIWNNIVADGAVIASFEVDSLDVVITDIYQSGSNIVVEWASSNGWQYMCESAENMGDDPIVWDNVSPAWIVSVGSLMSEIDTNAWSRGQRFYRVNAKP